MISFIGWTLAAIAVWCVFCWIVGYVLFCYSCPKTSRDDPNFADIGVGPFFAMTVIYAPVFLPAMIFSFFSRAYTNLGWKWRNRAIMKRQNEMEKYLEEKLVEAGIKVQMKHLRDEPCISNRDWELANSNLEFKAEVGKDQIEIYKQIMGELFQRFPWIVVNTIGIFVPIRFLDRQWAEKYKLSHFAAPIYSQPCACGCNKVMIRFHDWVDQEDLDKDWEKGSSRLLFDCRTVDLEGFGDIYGKMPVRELMVELSAEEKTNLLKEFEKEK